MRGSDARSRSKVCKVQAEASLQEFGETISFVLTGGISVLMCFVGRKTRSGSKNPVGRRSSWRSSAGSVAMIRLIEDGEEKCL